MAQPRTTAPALTQDALRHREHALDEVLPTAGATTSYLAGGVALRALDLEGSSFTASLADELRERLNVECCGILRLMPGGESLVLEEAVGWIGEGVGSLRVEAGLASMAGYAILKKDLVVVEDLEAEARFTAPDVLIQRGATSSMAAPIRVRDEVHGVLAVHTITKRSFTPADQETLREAARVLGAAIGARNTLRQALGRVREVSGDAERWRSRLAVSSAASERLCAAQNPREAARVLANCVVPALADWCLLDVIVEQEEAPYPRIERIAVAHGGLADSRAEEVLGRFQDDYSADSGATHYTSVVWRTVGPEIIEEVTDEDRRAARGGDAPAILDWSDARSLICAPLIVRGNVIGALTVISTSEERHYDQEDLALVEDLARQSALALTALGLPEYRPGDSNTLVGRARSVLSLPDAARETNVTPTQYRVLQLLPTGMTYREIGKELNMGESSVKTHVGRLYGCLGVASKSALIRHARHVGIIPFR